MAEDNIRMDVGAANDENQIQYHKEDYPSEKFKEDFIHEKSIQNDGKRSVKKYHYKPWKRSIAVKSIIAESEISNKIKDEAEKLWRFRNSSQIVKMFGITVVKWQPTEWETLICMELMDMSLDHIFRWIVKKETKLSNLVLCAIATNVIMGLAELKAQKIMHRDIKPGNILVNRTGEVKLGDFGDAKFFERHDITKTSTGTYAYWSLERFDNAHYQLGYDDKSDIWSLAVIMIQLITHERPYSELGKHGVDIQRAREKTEELQGQAWKKLTEVFSKYVQEENLKEDLRNFIALCLQPNESRLDCVQLLENSFIKIYSTEHASRQECVREYFQNIQLDLIENERRGDTIPSLEHSSASSNIEFNPLRKGAPWAGDDTDTDDSQNGRMEEMD
uniref:mitogen-activated protein kinase kinase n=1 Tax=Acrobeloides nanus TaxID=290746 RepID=A0A914DLA7_9BILA